MEKSLWLLPVLFLFIFITIFLARIIIDHTKYGQPIDIKHVQAVILNKYTKGPFMAVKPFVLIPANHYLDIQYTDIKGSVPVSTPQYNQKKVGETIEACLDIYYKVKSGTSRPLLEICPKKTH